MLSYVVVVRELSDCVSEALCDKVKAQLVLDSTSMDVLPPHVLELSGFFIPQVVDYEAALKVPAK